MNPKYIIGNCAKSNTGKSDSLNKFIDIVKKSGMNNVVYEEWIYDGSTGRNTDRYIKLLNSEVKIAVMTQGDKGDSALKDELIDAVSWGADVIVCAANQANQINSIPQLDPYERVWFHNPEANCGIKKIIGREAEAYASGFAYGTVAVIETLYAINLI